MLRIYKYLAVFISFYLASTTLLALDDEEALLKATAANPHDSLAAVVFADWLDEHNRPLEAEFIRKSVRLRDLEDNNGAEPLTFIEALEKFHLEREIPDLFEWVRQQDGTVIHRYFGVWGKDIRWYRQYMKILFPFGLPVQAPLPTEELQYLTGIQTTPSIYHQNLDINEGSGGSFLQRDAEWWSSIKSLRLNLWHLDDNSPQFVRRLPTTQLVHLSVNVWQIDGSSWGLDDPKFSGLKSLKLDLGTIGMDDFAENLLKDAKFQLDELTISAATYTTSRTVLALLRAPACRKITKLTLDSTRVSWNGNTFNELASILKAYTNLKHLKVENFWITRWRQQSTEATRARTFSDFLQAIKNLRTFEAIFIDEETIQLLYSGLTGSDIIWKELTTLRITLPHKQKIDIASFPETRFPVLREFMTREYVKSRGLVAAAKRGVVKIISLAKQPSNLISDKTLDAVLKKMYGNKQSSLKDVATAPSPSCASTFK